MSSIDAMEKRVLTGAREKGVMRKKWEQRFDRRDEEKEEKGEGRGRGERDIQE